MVVKIKYVPNECIKFLYCGNISTRLQPLRIQPQMHPEDRKEKSTYETGKFLQSLEKKMGFKVSIIQVDNGAEFVNDEERTDKLGLFQKIAESPGMQIRKTQADSSWQNGKDKSRLQKS